MMPHYPLAKVPSCHKGTQWQTLIFGATHYLEFLLAGSSQTLSEKSVFGLSVVVTGDGKFCAGRQRFNYELKVKGEKLKKRDAAASMIRNMAQLAHAQLDMTHSALPPRKSRSKKKSAPNNNNNNNQDHTHRDYAEDTANQACIVSGIVVKEGVHFDAMFLIRSNDRAWSLHGIQPLYLQFHTEQGTTPQGDKRYWMDYKPNGVTPLNRRHERSLVEKAIAPDPEPPPAPQAPAPAPPAEMPPPSEPLPPLRLPPALAERLNLPPDPEDLPTESETLDDNPPLLPLPPHLAAALAQAEASQSAPLWTAQLQEALQEGRD